VLVGEWEEEIEKGDEIDGDEFECWSPVFNVWIVMKLWLAGYLPTNHALCCTCGGVLRASYSLL